MYNLLYTLYILYCIIADRTKDKLYEFPSLVGTFQNGRYNKDKLQSKGKV